jgi:hypothetical protein
MKKIIQTVMELPRKKGQLIDSNTIERRRFEDTHPGGKVRGEREAGGFSQRSPVGL